MKKNGKFILVLLVILVIGYIILMGGPKEALNKIQNGNYFSFTFIENKNNDNSWGSLTDDIKTEVDDISKGMKNNK